MVVEAIEKQGQDIHSIPLLSLNLVKLSRIVTPQEEKALDSRET